MTAVTVPPPDPPRPDRRVGDPDPLARLARVALVVVLLALAAHGLSGRSGLDWSRLDDSPGQGVGLLLAFVGGAIVVVAVRTMVQSVRKAASLVPDDAELPDVEGRRLPWWFWLGAGLVLLGLLAGIYELVQHVAPSDPQLPEQGDLVNDPARGADRPQPPSTLSLVALVLGGHAVAQYIGSRMVTSRRGDPGPEPEPEPDGDDEAEAANALAGAVDVAGEQLGRYDDERTAILAAYRAMESQLAAVGAVRRPSDTPTDYLRRAVATAHVSRGAAGRLTDLFREARFSTHPMPPGSRDDAARALRQVAADLTRTRA
jgi:hypothetical protein